MKLKLNAQLLRYVLLGVMVLLLLLAIVSFLFAAKQLRSYADSTNLLASEAAAGDQNINNLQQLQTVLVLDADAIEKTHQIVAEAKSYRYQDEIVKDLTSYANESGVTIESFTFVNATDSTTTTPAVPTSPTPAPTTPSIPGVKSTTVNVAIESPVDYTKVMKFIQRIEENTTKMQIGSISMSRVVDEEVPPGSVDISAMEIQVYIR